MPLYNFYVLSGSGRCLFYHEWQRAAAAQAPAEDRQLMFGLLHSLRALCASMSPVEGGGVLRSFQTNGYKCHVFEAPTGVVFVVNTDTGTPDLSPELRRVHATLYVDSTSRNPLHRPGDPLEADGFRRELLAVAARWA